MKEISRNFPENPDICVLIKQNPEEWRKSQENGNFQSIILVF